MASKLVTCPETAHLEQIEYVEHPLGLLITGCSRFAPPCAIECERSCAARLDRRRCARAEELDAEEEDTHVNILVCAP